ncbi:MAG TPA: GntR family transcriptional regulator [Gammaproteobacteria bacterium]|nr:GntR family transcriptional regulator [Gammaproteobacteria bacterium]
MGSNESKPLRRSLTDEVRDHIRDGIAEGRYLPGEWLKENVIGEELKVSRTPIREAVRILEAEGLIVMEPWKGITVATLSRRQVSDFYSYREIIEGLAAEMAARVITDDDIERLDAILLQLEEGRDQTGSELGKVNEQFHYMISDISGNRFLNQSLEVINTAKILIWKPVYRKDKRWEMAQQEHRKLFDALRARDPIGAKAVAQEHVRSAGLTRVAAMVSEELEADNLK